MPSSTKRLTSKSWCAIASEIVDTVVADAAVEARVFSAVVDVGLAIFALESRGTIALVVVDQVHTTAPIETGIFLAFVDVHVAILTLESGEAIASKVIDQIDATCSIEYAATYVRYSMDSVPLP